MPSTYKRKTDRQSWSEEAMSRALEALRNGTCGYLKAAKQFNVPKSTLERRFKNKNKQALDHSKQLGSRKLTFPMELEKQLVDYVKNMEAMLYGRTTRSIRSLAYQIAVRNNIVHHFNNETKLAGWHWLHSFLKRNNLSLRSPEATSAARAQGFNREAVGSFFDILKSLQEKHNFPPSRIFNVDETGITTVQSRPSKIIAARGRKQVGSLTSAERGELTTVVICMSPSGIFVPPMLIFPRVRMKPQFADGTPPGSLSVCHKSGWMQLELFEKWFDHFVHHTQTSKSNPVLLILDGHKTHTQNIATIEKARQNGVTILCLPPHTSHRMQPLDVSFMGPLTTFYTQEVEIWLRNHPGRRITINEVGSLFAKAYLRGSTPLNAINGFKKTGLYPLDHTVFTEDMYAAALPTSYDPPQNNDSTENDAVAAVSPEMEDAMEQIQRDFVRESTPDEQIITQVEKPSTSSMCNLISPETIAPYPKAKNVKLSKKKVSRKGKAAILTSTPYKEELEKSLVQKNRKNNADKMKTNRITFKNKNAANNSSSKGKKQESNVTKARVSRTQSSSSESDVDVECLFCGNNYSKDHCGEGWIMCCRCGKWAHDECAGVESDDDDEFTCDICLQK
ncbi:uncharacterized protein [Tenebrio molitor]|jgi:hypothetical protein|uniref:HTH CENPB-type domain-containing protein n=1 Tax=Tenebrio molitor TaxID=7067 RepID=A0A8J6HII9_TENMO|nr:hypothetical protein GEV33_007511 [Tenebrio molitor]